MAQEQPSGREDGFREKPGAQGQEGLRDGGDAVVGLGEAEFTTSSEGWGPGDPVTGSHMRQGVAIWQS